MGFFTNLSIRNKILTAFSAILFLTMALGLFTITRVECLDARAMALAANVQATLPLGIMDRDAHQLAGQFQAGQSVAPPAPRAAPKPSRIPVHAPIAKPHPTPAAGHDESWDEF